MRCKNSLAKGIQNEQTLHRVCIRTFSLETWLLEYLLFNVDYIFRNEATIHQSGQVLYTPSVKKWSSTISITALGAEQEGRVETTSSSNFVKFIVWTCGRVCVCFLEVQYCNCEWNSGKTQAAVHSSVQHDSQSPDCNQCQKVAHTQRGILSRAHWWDETGWLLPRSEVEWKTNVMEGDRERLCLISPANVSDGSYLAPCSAAVYYPKVAGRCWEEKRTGSPFVIHHSGGLLPLLSDRYMDNCSTCLQMPAHLNE